MHQPRHLTVKQPGLMSNHGPFHTLPNKRQPSHRLHHWRHQHHVGLRRRVYTGEQWDADAGAYYLRARWYLPEWGMFLSRDAYEGEVDDPITQNRFLYANTNPIRYVDPSGHMTIIDLRTMLANRMWNRGTHGRMTVRSVRKVKSRL
jgi:RHS repeat-associated protein